MAVGGFFLLFGDCRSNRGTIIALASDRGVGDELNVAGALDAGARVDTDDGAALDHRASKALDCEHGWQAESAANNRVLRFVSFMRNAIGHASRDPEFNTYLPPRMQAGVGCE